MNSAQRQQVRSLVKKYSDSGTESLIAYVAETNGMLAACQALMDSLDAADSTSIEWLQRECSEENVTFHAFLQEVTKIVTMFQPSRDVEDHRATLGVSADAGLDEIKQAYRVLSLRYHPDTALPPYCDNPEKFIAINKAYHALMSVGANGRNDEFGHQEKQWRRKKERTVSPEQRKKVFTWTLLLLIVLVVISIIASMNFKKRAMLAGLQESRGAFIPPARRVSDVSYGKEDKVKLHPTEPLSLARDTTKTPASDLVAKVEMEPEVDPFSVRLQELSQRDFGKAPAVPAGAFKEQWSVNQAGEARLNRAKDKTAVVDAADHSSASESTVGNASSTTVAHNSDGQYVGGKEKSEKTGKRAIILATEDKDVKKKAKVGTERTSQIPTTLKHQKMFRQQIENKDHEPVFNTKVQTSVAEIMDIKTEREAQLTYATVAEVVPLPAHPLQVDKRKPEKPDMQMRVDHFFANYIKAYEQRNLILFARFFDANAEENGKSFAAILPTYFDLFAATKHVSLQVEQKNWHTIEDKVTVDGQFKVHLEYMDGRTLNGSGPIDFTLVDNGGELLVKKMEYIFHAD